MGDKWFREIDGNLCISTEGLSHIMDVTKAAVLRWGQQGCPKAKRGWWPLRDVLKWRGLASTTGGSDREKTLMQRKLEAEVALKEAQGELTKLKNDITAGRYLEVEYVEAELKRFFIVFKRSVNALPRRLAGIAARFLDTVETRRIEKDASDMLNGVLEQFSIGNVTYNGKKK